MDESTSRRRAVTECRRSRVASRLRFDRVAFWAAAIAVVVMMAGAASAQGETSPRYQRLWDGVSDRKHRWARQTSECESGGDRNIHSSNGSYHGAFQFSLSTWRNAPKSPGGDPHRYTWKTQAVVAIYLKKRDGARTHWPSCG